MPGRYLTAFQSVAINTQKLLDPELFNKIALDRAAAKKILISAGLPEASAEDSLHYKYMNISGKHINLFGLVEIFMDYEFEKINTEATKSAVGSEDLGGLDQVTEALKSDVPDVEDYQAICATLDVLTQFSDKYVKEANQVLGDNLKSCVSNIVKLVSAELKKSTADAHADDALLEEWSNLALQTVIRYRLADGEAKGQYGVYYPTFLAQTEYPTVLEEIDPTGETKPLEDIYLESQSLLHPHLTLEELQAVVMAFTEKPFDESLNIALKSLEVQALIGASSNWYIGAQYELRRDMSRYLEGCDLFKDRTGFDAYEPDAKLVATAMGG